MSTPEKVRLRRGSGLLEVHWSDGVSASLSAEFLRVHSPSAEVQGHGGGPSLLVTGKSNVGFVKLEPVGHYAVKLVFDDGHDSGLFSFDRLRQFALNYNTLWQQYLDRLEREGGSRDPEGPKLFSVKNED